MNASAVRELSSMFAPPRMNLRSAARLDSPYGDDRFTDREINHRSVDDVTRADLDFYARCFSYMDFPSLLFYFYPVASHYESDNSLECINPFLYSLDPHIPSSSSSLNPIAQSAINSGLRWVRNSSRSQPADFDACPNLLSAIGIGDTKSGEPNDARESPS